MDNSLLSLIVPVYNGKKYLEECIGSILESSYKNFEVILVDDGSDEETRKLCNELVKIDSRIQVFHKENERNCFG